MSVSSKGRGTLFTSLKIAILCIFIAASFVSASVISRLPFRYQQHTSAGQPYIEAQDTKIAGKITSITADDSYLYCCWGKRHIVKIYDFDGQHISTIAISDAHNKGGTLMIGNEAERVVVFSDAHCYYFENGNFVSFDPQGNQGGQLRNLRKAADSAENTYTIQNGYVVRQTSGEVDSMFVSSPAFLRLITPDTIRIFDSLLMICLLILHWAKEKLES